MGPRAEDIFVLIERYNVESDTPLWRRKGDNFLLGILHQALAGPRSRLDTYGKQSAIRVFRKVEDGAARAIQHFVRRRHANVPVNPQSHRSVVVEDAYAPNAYRASLVPARPDSRACCDSMHEFPRPVTIPRAKRQPSHQTNSQAQPRFDDALESQAAPHTLWFGACGARRVEPLEKLRRQTAVNATSPTYCRVEGNAAPPCPQRHASCSSEATPHEYATPAAPRSCVVTPTSYNTMRQAESSNDASIASSDRWGRAKWTHCATRWTPDTSTPVSNPRTSPTDSIDEPIAVVPPGCVPQYHAVYKPRNSYGRRRTFVLETSRETSPCAAENSHETEQQDVRNEARNSQRFLYRKNRRNVDRIGQSDQANAST